ncbi:unnamed protein product [Candidula unifasciata]|uniref:C1q domain-containing protein n=1 Tax=Candidula unifasciata TaxID=100452 RepID=A0A8S3ZDV4_9EUPU|nr:unnamed protein product [Candidula unifasciata]
MMSARTDLNQKIISVNLDMMEEQRHHMHQALDEYVDKVISAGRQWTRSVDRNQSTFLQVHIIINKAMAFLSLKLDEMEREHFSCLLRETDCIAEDEFTRQQKHVEMVSVVDDVSRCKTLTSQGDSSGEDSADILNNFTCRDRNLECGQQPRYGDLYNQLQNVLAKQDGYDQQMNMKIHDLKEEMESLKSDVDQIKTDLSNKIDEINAEMTGKVDEIKTEILELVDESNIDLSNKVDKINTDLSAKVDQINTDMSGRIDEINADLSGKIDEVNLELSEKVDEINTDLTEKYDQIDTELSDKIEQINADLSRRSDQINVVSQTLTNNELEKAALTHKIVALENHLNTIEKDMHDNIRQVEQQLDGMGTNYTVVRELFINRLAPLEKLRDILNGRATSQSENVRQLQAVMTELKDLSGVVETCVRKLEVGVVGFKAETKCLINSLNERQSVSSYQSPRLMSGCQFDSSTGKFTAAVDGIYLAYINLRINRNSVVTIYLMHRDKSRDCTMEICLARAEIKHFPVFNTDMVEMKAGDELFIIITKTSPDPCLCDIQFSCLKIG